MKELRKSLKSKNKSRNSSVSRIPKVKLSFKEKQRLVNKPVIQKKIKKIISKKQRELQRKMDQLMLRELTYNRNVTQKKIGLTESSLTINRVESEFNQCDLSQSGRSYG
jgi:hypothetical protein